MVDILRNDLAARVLEKALDGLSLRQRAITDNVANVDTPNFKSFEVSFEEDLQSAIHQQPRKDALPLATSDPRHQAAPPPASLDAVSPRISQMLATTLRNDGNNVDIDREMSRLAEAQIHFHAATQLMNVKFQQLKTAIWEGKR
jgi:flagellar basal-body rod protein FlgB